MSDKIKLNTAQIGAMLKGPEVAELLWNVATDVGMKLDTDYEIVIFTGHDRESAFVNVEGDKALDNSLLNSLGGNG